MSHACTQILTSSWPSIALQLDGPGLFPGFIELGFPSRFWMEQQQIKPSEHAQTPSDLDSNQIIISCSDVLRHLVAFQGLTFSF